MKHSSYLTLAMFLAFGVGAAVAQEQGKAKSLTVIGPVKTVSGGSLTVDTAKGTLQFVVGANTRVSAKGASTKAREKKAAGEGGLKISDVVHEGDQVFVKYVEAGGNLLATDVEVRQRRSKAAQPIK